MNSRLFKQGPVFWSRRRFSLAPAPENEVLWRRLEGEHFHRVMSSRPGYYVGKTLTVEVNDASQAVRDFLDAPSRSLHREVCRQIVNEAPTLPSSSVEALLLKMHSSMSTETGLKIMNEYPPLTAALAQRSHDLIESQQSLELEFTLADLFFRINRLRWYAAPMIKRQASALKYLTETDFIQHLFFSYIFRALEPETCAAVPTFVDNVFDDLDLEEIALVCFVLFNTQYRLPRSDQWLRIVNAFEKHKGPVSDVTLGVLAKYFRYLTPTRKNESLALKKFLAAASQRHSEWTLSTHLRMANVGTQAHVGNPDVVKGVMAKLMANLDTCRIKDVALGLYSNAYFGFDIKPSAARAIIERLHKENCASKYHHWLVRSTFSLAVLGSYDETLLVKSLDRDVINFATTHELVWFDTYALYTVCRLMFPHLFEDKIRLTQDDMRYPHEKVLLLTENLRSYNMNLQRMQGILVQDLGLKTELKQTLDLFPYRDIHVGNNLIIACHAAHFYSDDGQLLGLRRFRITLLRAAKFKVVEIHPDFFTLQPNKKIQHLRTLLGDHIHGAV